MTMKKHFAFSFWIATPTLSARNDDFTTHPQAPPQGGGGFYGLPRFRGILGIKKGGIAPALKCPQKHFLKSPVILIAKTKKA